MSEEEALALADAIREVKETVGHCEVCFNLATEATCRICQDERRESAMICVVEQPSDVIPIERSGEFHGRYHVLGGALSPIDGVDPEHLHISELLGRVSNGAAVTEVVIATGVLLFRKWNARLLFALAAILIQPGSGRGAVGHSRVG